MTRTEAQANAALGAYYDERARWMQVLGRPANRPARPTAQKSFIARLLGL